MSTSLAVNCLLTLADVSKPGVVKALRALRAGRSNLERAILAQRPRPSRRCASSSLAPSLARGMADQVIWCHD
jgi:hypothetical protein